MLNVIATLLNVIAYAALATGYFAIGFMAAALVLVLVFAWRSRQEEDVVPVPEGPTAIVYALFEKVDLASLDGGREYLIGYATEVTAYHQQMQQWVQDDPGAEIKPVRVQKVEGRYKLPDGRIMPDSWNVSPNSFDRPGGHQQ